MPDIAMCHGETMPPGRRVCPMRDTCYRYTATPTPQRQSYFASLPIIGDRCDYYSPSRNPTRNTGAL